MPLTCFDYVSIITQFIYLPEVNIQFSFSTMKPISLPHGIICSANLRTLICFTIIPQTLSLYDMLRSRDWA